MRPTEHAIISSRMPRPDALRTTYRELKALRGAEGRSRQGDSDDDGDERDGEDRARRSSSREGIIEIRPTRCSRACRRCFRRLPKDAPLNRLTLAKWLVDPGHPLTRAGRRQPVLAERTSASASSRRRKISASRASRQSIRSCSTGWRRNSCAPDGTFARCSG